MAIDRTTLLDWFDENRRRSREIFSLVDDSAYYERPIPLRNPIIFYEGHLPAFSVNTLVKTAIGERGVDDRLETLFARGIDPDSESAADLSQASAWPSRDEVRNYVRAADELVRSCLEHGKIEDGSDPHRANAASSFTILEHESMHHETLLYMLHQLRHESKRRPADADPVTDGSLPPPAEITIPPGTVTLGARRDELIFGWDNEFESERVDVDAFTIDQHSVSNNDYLRFVEAGGYTQPQWWTAEGWEWLQAHHVQHPIFWARTEGRWMWRGMFDWIPLPPSWPAYVSHCEASAYARWKGRRLMTEAEFHRAAYGTPSGVESCHPWGDQPPEAGRGNFDFQSWEPRGVGSFPAGQSAWGVHDLVGNGWEWTSTVFAPFRGFVPMATYPQYSADFFDGEHYVMKGASPATARTFIRRSFRNWFRPTYPYVYAKFRCVR